LARRIGIALLAGLCATLQGCGQAPRPPAAEPGPGSAGGAKAATASRAAAPGAGGEGPLPALDRHETIRAVYLSYFGVGDRAIRERVLRLIDETELNAVVVDVKGDRGLIPYETDVALAREAGAMGPVRYRGFDGLVAQLKRKSVYTIARVVVFKDDVLARHRPDWAVLDTRTGRPWVDSERLAWIDPFRTDAWEYAVAVAGEAARKGFHEIQFDYLRFPADGELHAARYSRPLAPESRTRAIAGFLARARQALEGTGAALAIDVFGYAAFNRTDSEIGQLVEELAPLVDYLCPMAYPSAYHRGIPGYANPVAHPYEVVFETVRRVRERTAHARARVRPWIQDFRDYAFDRRAFGVQQVRAQMRGALESGAGGWMLWNPRNEYTEAALDRVAPGTPSP
jgi:hypothetical protein